MKLSDFDFTLPTELIAQKPEKKRDESNLLIAAPNNHLVQSKFYDIIDYLCPGDLMVFNDSKVIKAKLLLNKDGKKIDLYLNKPINNNCWHGFAKPSKRLNEGDQFDFGCNKIIISKKLVMGQVEVEFFLDNLSVFEFLEKYGEIPLPPYIKRQENLLEDNNRYQTVYSKKLGAVASPTAGLHFSDELLALIKAKNIETAFITLHVGAGTFLPVKTEDIDQHKMHSEYYHIDKKTADIINKAKKESRRIIAVGTTSLRALESSSIDGHGQIQDGEFETTIFIRPGFKFQIVDMLVTNFHLPKSTLFMLVCAFAGYQEITDIYKYAIDKRMRFFSYGDAMLLYKKL
ncbi:tRNA preQ1(34) S-adenosylmethionine ribosyltransferase-isomerase QueA [Candidatus Tisiphia endosymbiont of Melanophora roralis]|uniref:tRNA preQ1(34) S-adenosylmethionine ribosyltransferase-isomerase QueA n=1 Tax=Candidatus Tisiphia endosymbiont of Melanophora roralis TaxID=3066261 RepID=UPI001E7C23CD|nr:MAG: tRNA preQ1(34) S-adenosylmethionine ribosyltransferase-isomerase QueA [Rickettsia endosymbiont of Cimex lectularius]